MPVVEQNKFKRSRYVELEVNAKIGSKLEVGYGLMRHFVSKKGNVLARADIVIR